MPGLNDGAPGLSQGTGLSYSIGLYGGTVGLEGGSVPVPVVSVDFLTSTALPSWLTWTNPNGHRTMFDSTGKLTWAPNNLVTYSNDFSNGSWTKAFTASVTGSTISLPATTDEVYQSGVGNAGETYILSVTLSGSGDLFIGVYDNVSGIQDTFITLSSTPTRVYQKFTFGAGSTDRRVYPCTRRSNGSTTATSVVVTDFQLERVTYETTPRTYNATTSAAYYGPRMDYNPATLLPRGLLIEGSRQNLCYPSNNFAATWLLGGSASLSANSTTSPDGTTNASTLSNSSAFHGLARTPTLASTSVHVFSLFIKKTSGATTFPGISFNNATNYFSAAINTNSGVITGRTGELPTVSGIEDAGDYWRAWVGGAGLVGGSTVYIYPCVNSDASATWTGGNGSCIIYGAQLELGSFPTSYIPTISASVTRNAETVTLGGAALSALQGTVGAAILEEESIAYSSASVMLGAAAVAYLRQEAADQVSTYDASATPTTVSATAGASGSNFGSGNSRVGITWDASNRWVAMNGGTVGTNTGTFVSSRAAARLGAYTGGGSPSSGWYRYAAFYTAQLNAGLLSTSTVAASTGPTTGFLLENGTDFLLLENGDYLVQE